MSSGYFSAENLQARRKWHDTLKCQKKTNKLTKKRKEKINLQLSIFYQQSNYSELKKREKISQTREISELTMA